MGLRAKEGKTMGTFSVELSDAGEGKRENEINYSGAPNEYFSENGPLTTENQNLDAFKAFSSTFLCCWKEFICSSLPAG